MSDGGGVVDSGQGVGLTQYQDATGWTFSGIRIATLISQEKIQMLEPFCDFYLATGMEGAQNTLEALVEIILEKPDKSLALEGSFYVNLTYLCTWSHVGKVFLIQHRLDPFSFMILGNTDRGLFISLHGKWQEIEARIGRLAAQWALANKPAKPPKRSGWKEPRNSGWSDGFI